MNKRILIPLISALALVTSACAAQPATPSGPRTLTVLTHESFALSEDVLEEFESANNATVQFLKQPDAGQALNRAILTKDSPEADVLFGVDNTFFSRAIDADILEDIEDAAGAEVDEECSASSLDDVHVAGIAIPIETGDDLVERRGTRCHEGPPRWSP